MNPSQGMAVEEWEMLEEPHLCVHMYPRWQRQQHRGCNGVRVKAWGCVCVPGCSSIEGLLRVLLKCRLWSVHDHISSDVSDVHVLLLLWAF